MDGRERERREGIRRRQSSQGRGRREKGMGNEGGMGERKSM